MPLSAPVCHIPGSLLLHYPGGCSTFFANEDDHLSNWVKIRANCLKQVVTGKNKWNRCAPGRYRHRALPNQCCVPIWSLKAQNWDYNHSKIIGPAILSYFTHFTVKNRCKGETGVHWGGTDVENYQINVVYQYHPLKLKTEIKTTPRSLDPPFCHTSPFSPVKTGAKVKQVRTGAEEA